MLVPSMDDSVLQRSVVVTQHSCRINKRDHATMLTPELHTYRQEPMYVMALLESKYTFFMDSVSWLTCGYQLADSEAFQVLAVKGHCGFWADLYAFCRNSIARDAGSRISR